MSLDGLEIGFDSRCHHCRYDKRVAALATAISAEHVQQAYHVPHHSRPQLIVEDSVKTTFGIQTIQDSEQKNILGVPHT